MKSNNNRRKVRSVNAKGRNTKGTFTSLPHHIQDSEAFISLSPKAVKLFINMLRDYCGYNNGDIACTFKMMQKRGWKSDQHMRKARDELLDKGFIVRTRIGDRRRPNLYAFTWWGIDECGGKLDVKPNPVPLNFWMDGKNPWHEKIEN
jgi:hypothetical protein